MKCVNGRRNEISSQQSLVSLNCIYDPKNSRLFEMSFAKKEQVFMCFAKKITSVDAASLASFFIITFRISGMK